MKYFADAHLRRVKVKALKSGDVAIQGPASIYVDGYASPAGWHRQHSTAGEGKATTVIPRKHVGDLALQLQAAAASHNPNDQACMRVVYEPETESYRLLRGGARVSLFDKRGSLGDLFPDLDTLDKALQSLGLQRRGTQVFPGVEVW